MFQSARVDGDNVLRYQAILRPRKFTGHSCQENTLTSLFGYRKTTGWTGTPGINAPAEGERDTSYLPGSKSPAHTSRVGLRTKWASLTGLPSQRPFSAGQVSSTSVPAVDTQRKPQGHRNRHKGISWLRRFGGSEGLPCLLRAEKK